MLLQWLLAGGLVLASGLGILQSAVSLQSYVLLVVGLGFTVAGTVLMVRDEPAKNVRRTRA